MLVTLALTLVAGGCIIREPGPVTVAPASAPNTPQECGQVQASAYYGPVQPGAQIVLGRHRLAPGADDNWAENMGPYVGRTATVTSLGGVDDAGCPGVRVDIDGGEWFWRIRDAYVVSAAAAAPTAHAPSGAIPLQCGMSSSAPYYGPVQIGSTVVLGRHSPVAGDDNWAADMNMFVGQMATVTQFASTDAQGCPGVRVNIDGGEWFWRIRDMTLGSGIPLACGQASEAAYYGPVTLGSVVILGRHSPVAGDDNWAQDMNIYVGQTARVTQFAGTDAQGCPGVRVDIDGGEWFWRIRDSHLVR